MGALEEMAADFQRLADGSFDAEVQRRATPLVEAAVKASAAAGTTPDGQPWAVRKDGGRALVNAAAAIAVKSYPGVLRIILTGVEVFAHFGKGARQVARKIIPDTGTMPKAIADAIGQATDEAFARVFGGGR